MSGGLKKVGAHFVGVDLLLIVAVLLKIPYSMPALPSEAFLSADKERAQSRSTYAGICAIHKANSGLSYLHYLLGETSNYHFIKHRYI
jgi:hypothetical protein